MGEFKSWRDDPRPTDELVRLALATDDEDERWEYVPILQLRDKDDVLDQIWRLCASEDTKERVLGIDILAQNKAAKKRFPQRTVALLRRFLKPEYDAETLYSAAIAAGHSDYPSLVAPLVKLKRHPDPDVRFGVSFGLSHLHDAEAIATLIALSQDDSSKVRDWATFGLGTQLDISGIDSDEIRAALVARLTDEDEDTRCEAMRGLALRGDQRAVEPIVRELDLQGDDISQIVFEAAIEAGKRNADPRLYEQLLRLLDFASYALETEDIREAMRYQEKALGLPAAEESATARAAGSAPTRRS